MRRLVTSALLRRLIVVQLVLSLIPLGVVSIFALSSLTESRNVVVAESQKDFDAQAFQSLRARALSVAQSISAFLQEREGNARSAASLARTPQAYLDYARSYQGRIWTVMSDGKETTFTTPLFREIAFVNTQGQEVVKVINQCSRYPFACEMKISDDLRKVADPANTLYKNETYFSEAMAIDRNAIYVGKPVGAYVPYEHAYAGAQNREGDRYRGVLRFAVPVYDGDVRAGIVVVAVETIHLVELTAHVSPANPALQAEVDPREADFAYVVDPEGLAIAHPRHFNIAGVDEQGRWVPGISQADRSDPNNLYRPGNLAQMGFIDPSFPQIVKANANGEAVSGQTLTARPLGSPERAMAFATIPYRTGRYNTTAGFGVVVLSTDGARFHLDSELLGKQIENRVTSLTDQVRWLGIATLLVAIVSAILLALGVATPILRLTSASTEIEQGNWEKVDVDRLAGTKGGDEVSRLTRVFASMSREVRTRELQLRQQVQKLQIIIDEAKRERAVKEIVDSDFFQDLTQKAKKLREQRRKDAPPGDQPGVHSE
jgi:hypothetical protein